MTTKTQKAVDLYLAGGLSQSAAAKQAGVNPAALSRALDRIRDKHPCPCCGQVVKEIKRDKSA